jgi:hypothetical protein
VRRPDALYLATLSNLRDFRDRFIPVRELSPRVLYSLHELGIKPDLFFLDSTKTGEELEVFRELWPDAIIAADDRTHQEKPGSGIYEIREAVIPFAKKYGLTVIDKDATWFLKDPRLQPKSFVA